MSGALVDTCFLASDELYDLYEILECDTAEAYLLRLWDHGMRAELVSGVIKLTPIRLAEMVRWHGDRRLLLDALVKTRFLVPDAEREHHYYMRGWSRNASYLRDKERRKMAQRKRRSAARESGPEPGDAAGAVTGYVPGDDTRIVTGPLTLPYQVSKKGPAQPPALTESKQTQSQPLPPAAAAAAPATLAVGSTSAEICNVQDFETYVANVLHLPPLKARWLSRLRPLLPVGHEEMQAAAEDLQRVEGKPSAQLLVTILERHRNTPLPASRVNGTQTHRMSAKDSALVESLMISRQMHGEQA